MKSEIINKNIGQLISQCQAEDIECLIITMDADLTENIKSMGQRSREMQRNIESVAAQRWKNIPGTDKMSFFQGQATQSG